MQKIDFLGIEEQDAIAKNRFLRKQARNILESYNHEWDVFSELFQNAIDAIDESHNVGRGLIEFTFDKRNNKLSISDNGIGIDVDRLTHILRPSVTYKHGKHSLRGEKGVGLSFLLFSTNNFEVESVSKNKKVYGRILNAYDWVSEKTDFLPILELTVDEDEISEPFTKFTLSGVFSIQDDINIFNYNLNGLKHILRTKTAVGNTSNLFGLPVGKDIYIKINYIDETGVEINETIPYSYDSPENYIKPNLSLDERKNKLSNNELRSVVGRAVHNFGTAITSSGKSLKYYYFVCGRNKYSEMSKQILGYEDRDFVRSGIFLSTKSMPTGVSIPPPVIGKEGYWSNLYIVVEYDELNLDMGRKSVPGRITQMIKGQAEVIYKEIAPHFTGILDTDNEIEEELNANQKIEDTWEILGEVDNLSINFLSHFKQPQTEQGVISIFYELIGQGKLQGYQTWRISSKDQYDAFVKYKKTGAEKLNKIILEFKYEASDIIRDIQDNIKEYSKINLLVCWDINEAKFTANGFYVTKYETDTAKFYSGATHEIRIPNIGRPIEVICLKTFLDKK